jgi:branched-chain amino acid transport system ATP-binding protein
MALLEVTELTRSFGAVRALSDVDLVVESGELLAVIGPNGSGKTTLFNCVSGRLKPSSGRIRWAGEDIAGRPMYKVARLGLVRTFQEARAFETGTVRENVELALAITSRNRGGGSSSEPQPTADHLLEITRLTEVADALPGGLPFGSLRHLGIAMALATSPRLLMLDEPAAGLNAAEGAALAEIIRGIHRTGVTLIVVDHDMDFLLPLVHRVVVLANGEKLTEGTPEEVRLDQRVVEVYFGSRAAQAQAVQASTVGD